jgi:hypothetical protein
MISAREDGDAREIVRREQLFEFRYWEKQQV